jgi:hypothetical protein
VRSLEDLIGQKIDELRDLWKACSRNRSRYALLAYVEAVLEFYRLLRARKRAKRAGERIADIYDFNLRDDMHTIRCIIEASSKATDKEKNRMTQALRYAFRKRWEVDIAEKFKENGGIKGCADKFGKENKRARYSRTNKKTKPQEISLPDQLEGGTVDPQARSVVSSLSGD